MKKCKNLFSVIISVCLIFALTMLSGCSSEMDAGQMSKALNAIQIDENTAYEIEVIGTNNTGDSVTINALTTIPQSSFQSLKTDVSVVSVSDGVTTENKLNVRDISENGVNQFKVYTTEEGKTTTEIVPYSKMFGSSVEGQLVTDFNLDELAQLNGLLDNVITKTSAKGVKEGAKTTITIDFIKYAMEQIDALKGVVETLKLTTTYGDIISAPAVDNLLKAYLSDFEAVDVYAMMASEIPVEYAQVLPSPIPGQTAYEYVDAIMQVEVGGVKLANVTFGVQALTLKQELLAELEVAKTQLETVSAVVTIVLNGNSLESVSAEFSTSLPFAQDTIISISLRMAKSKKQFAELS